MTGVVYYCAENIVDIFSVITVVIAVCFKLFLKAERFAPSLIAHGTRGCSHKFDSGVSRPTAESRKEVLGEQAAS